jgi:putative iron-dependent peroxidase
MTPQPGVLAPVPAFARATEWDLAHDAAPAAVRAALGGLRPDRALVVGIGAPLAHYLGIARSELHPFPAMSGAGVAAPSTQRALWTRVSGADPGEALHADRAVARALAPLLHPVRSADLFRYGEGRDLSGYVDGTENPQGDAASEAAFADDGSSFVAVQQWVHDLAALEAFDPAERDRMVGRRRADDVELEDAPAYAHVRRTAQESFAPPAFVVRRSMPWTDGTGCGLLFVAFGRSLAPFEAQLARMLGLEDGVVDALYRFTKPVTGGSYWCPPVGAGGAIAL